MDHVAEMPDASPLSDEHAELLATKWWTGEDFRRRGERSHFGCVASLIHKQGVPCREGPFTQGETDLVNDAIRVFKEVSSVFILVCVFTSSYRPRT